MALAVSRFPAGDARYVLYRLVIDGFVTMDRVEELRSRRKEDVGRVKTLLGQFDDDAREAGLSRARKKETKPRNRSPEVMAQQEAHGRFISQLRRIPKEDRGQVLRLYREGHREAALARISDIQTEAKKRHDAKSGVVDE